MHNKPFLSTPLFQLLILRESVYLSGTIPGYHLAILSLVFLFFPFRPLTPASHSLSFARSPFYMCPYRLSFLLITTCTRSSLTSILLLFSLFFFFFTIFTSSIFFFH